jgi:hypothetical protein
VASAEPRDLDHLPNCRFVLENSETENWSLFEDHNQLDYVHMRSMGASFNDFPAMVKKTFDHLAPGGWLEIQDGTWELFGDDGSTEGIALERFLDAACRGAFALGRDMTKSKHYKRWLEAAGFVDVVETVAPVPLTPWVQHPRWRRIGQYLSVTFSAVIDAYPRFLAATGMTPEEIASLSAEAKRDLTRRDIHPCIDT